MNKNFAKYPKDQEQLLEDCLMMHRYLYYVLGKPYLSDKEYDNMEACFLYNFPDNVNINKPGSDCQSSYSQHIIEMAESLANE